MLSRSGLYLQKLERRQSGDQEDGGKRMVMVLGENSLLLGMSWCLIGTGNSRVISSPFCLAGHSYYLLLGSSPRKKILA